MYRVPEREQQEENNHRRKSLPLLECPEMWNERKLAQVSVARFFPAVDDIRQWKLLHDDSTFFFSPLALSPIFVCTHNAVAAGCHEAMRKVSFRVIDELDGKRKSLLVLLESPRTRKRCSSSSDEGKEKSH
jgi:hypothetical protein